MEILRAYCIIYSTIDFQETENQLRKELASAYRDRLGESDYRLEWFIESLEPFELQILSPLLNKKKNACRYEDHDFVPNAGWAQKGIAQFSDIERKCLEQSYPSASGSGSETRKKSVTSKTKI